jgi:hypothetical protein
MIPVPPPLPYLPAMTSYPQARAQDLALHIPSPRLHFRSLANALQHVRNSLAYVLDALQRWDDAEWQAVEDTVARELSSGTMFLGGILDGLVILEASLSGAAAAAGRAPTAAMSAMSFERTPFGLAPLRALQDAAKGLRSCERPDQARYADFWTLVNFWKHYFPYQPRPSVFVRHGGARDIRVALGGGCDSGPVLRDLLVPTFNLACDMMRALAAAVREEPDAFRVTAL